MSERQDRSRVVWPLNAMDRAMRCIDGLIRTMGYPGFETQMLVWLDGRADADALRRGIARLSLRWPVVAARLVEPAGADGDEAHWRLRPGAVAVMEEREVRSAGVEAVLEHAAALLTIPHDLTRSDPIRFFLLHRPDGRDVLLLQYNHMLMDNGDSTLVVREIQRLAAAGDPAPCTERRNLILDYLRRYSHPRRREAARAALDLQGRTLHGAAATLRKEHPDSTGPPSLRFASRCVEAEPTRAIRAGVVGLCGYPSVSMAILASAFRAIARLSPFRWPQRRQFTAGIGMDLNLRAGHAPAFQNLMSLVPIAAEPEDLDDRDRLVRMLSGQMRQRIDERIDLGVLRMVGMCRRYPRHFCWTVEHFLRYRYSLWYAYFGSVDSVGQRLGGAPITQVTYHGPTWAAIGLTLLANQHRGRLMLQATYDPRLVPPDLADEFLDFIVEDLPRG
jgi:hypothetical protein